jgi:hypothetical protein
MHKTYQSAICRICFAYCAFYSVPCVAFQQRLESTIVVTHPSSLQREEEIQSNAQGLATYWVWTLSARFEREGTKAMSISLTSDQKVSQPRGVRLLTAGDNFLF